MYSSKYIGPAKENHTPTQAAAATVEPVKSILLPFAVCDLLPVIATERTAGIIFRRAIRKCGNLSGRWGAGIKYTGGLAVGKKLSETGR